MMSVNAEWSLDKLLNAGIFKGLGSTSTCGFLFKFKKEYLMMTSKFVVGDMDLRSFSVRDKVSQNNIKVKLVHKRLWVSYYGHRCTVVAVDKDGIEDYFVHISKTSILKVNDELKSVGYLNGKPKTLDHKVIAVENSSGAYPDVIISAPQ